MRAFVRETVKWSNSLHINWIMWQAWLKASWERLWR